MYISKAAEKDGACSLQCNLFEEIDVYHLI